jgi:hypothetical protein
MELWELSARECIRDTIARYNHAGDSGRFDEMIATFAPDGVLEIHGESRHEGRDALRAFFSNVRGESGGTRRMTVLRHCVTNTLIDIESPTEASARSYFQVITDIGLDHWGSYRDRLVPVGDRWLLAHRSVKTAGYAIDSFFAR